jgi:stearoyl-CoA desaturase (Delta-9 desaturase)
MVAPERPDSGHTDTSRPSGVASIPTALLRWFDGTAGKATAEDGDKRIDWLRAIPFIGLHLACFAVIQVGVSATAVWVAGALYCLRMFAITAFYHRYFSHRAFRTSRAAQFIFAVIGASAVQRGPLWWASHHRHHHAHADDAQDLHSPRRRGLLWSHLGWFLTAGSFHTRMRLVRDWAKFPELRLLDRWDILVPALLAAGLFLAGELLQWAWPGLETNGRQLLVWGFFISTVCLYHMTFTVNSLAHTLGSRRFQTRDDSRNNWFLAIVTFGEGWHNNHHHYPASARQGFYWWEIDMTFYVLKLMEQLGIIRDLKPVPVRIVHRRQAPSAAANRRDGDRLP